MTGPIARRVAYLIPIWLGISLVAFLLSSVTPGDPASLQFQSRTGRPPTADELGQERAALGLDLPAVVQFVRWVGSAATGDLGTSYRSGEPVTGLLLDR